MWRALAVALVVAGCARDDDRPRAVLKASGPLRIDVGEPRVIGDGEDLRIVRMADPVAPEDRSLDSVCLIYRNGRMATAQLVCPHGAPLGNYSLGGED